MRLLSRRNLLEQENLFQADAYIFLKLEIDGEVKMFRYFYSRSSGGGFNPSTSMMTEGGYYTMEKYILQIRDGELKRPKSLSFRKDMIEYFNDCPALSRKIEERSSEKRN